MVLAIFENLPNLWDAGGCIEHPRARFDPHQVILVRVKFYLRALLATNGSFIVKIRLCTSFLSAVAKPKLAPLASIINVCCCVSHWQAQTADLCQKQIADSFKHTKIYPGKIENLTSVRVRLIRKMS